jgi:plastocyanin
MKEAPMRQRSLVTMAAGTVLLLAACSGGGATTAPVSEPSAQASAPAAAAPCEVSSAAGEVAVTIAEFAFNPADITATAGQTITFTNNDSAPHTATLDDDSCGTPNIAQGASNGLTFSTAGTYPFHCAVHPNMKGTITVS